MNIKIPDSWIRDYIKTNAKPKDIEKALSLHSFSVEKVEKWKDGDTIYEIEVTPNRGDALSVLGIARELMAVLPPMDFEVEWVKPESAIPTFSGSDTLEVDIKGEKLVPRFSAVVLDKVDIKESPDFIKTRLEKVGIRAIDNIVDTTNYLMIELGQPMHAFDYDKISGHKMILRESKKGETLITLDSVERKLPEGVIVIEDGEGHLIDLCGIMGCQNSEVTRDTKKVLLFVQVYDSVRIRKASMSLGHRTEAALRFEKGVDIEGVVPGLCKAVEMLSQDSNIKASSEFIDILTVSRNGKSIEIDYNKMNRIAGVDIEIEFVDKVLTDLGFDVVNGVARVPSWRQGDIEIPEDLAEEVVRIYGYYNLPNELLKGEIPLKKVDKSFYWEDKVKDFLKQRGFFECYTYSTTKKELAGRNAIPMANPLSEDLAYLRSTLVSQLVNVLHKNRGYSDKIKVFELASVYKKKRNDLPDQPLYLSLATKGIEYLELKGIVEALFSELGISDFDPVTLDTLEDVLSIELNFGELVKKATTSRTYIPISKFNSIKEDFTFVANEDVSYEKVVKVIKKADGQISKVIFKDSYENAFTVSIEFLNREKQIASKDVAEIREKMLKELKSGLDIVLKG